MTINIVLAIGFDKNGKPGIGYNGSLPWYNKDDIMHFRNITRNSVVIMGRRTYESLKKYKDDLPLLKNKTNVVISSSICVDNIHPSVVLFTDINIALKYFSKMNHTINIIGGVGLYEYAISSIQNLNIYLTIIDGVYDIDTFIDFELRQNEIILFGKSFNILNIVKADGCTFYKA